MLPLGFVFPVGESEAAIQTDLHPGRPTQHRGWRSGSVSPGRAVGESMTLGHCQRLCDRTRKGSHGTGRSVACGGTHMLSAGDVQLCLHVLTTLLVALVQSDVPHVEGVLGRLCQARTEWRPAPGSAGCFYLDLWVNLVLSSAPLNLKLLYFEGTPVSRRGFSWLVPVLLSRDTCALVG